MSKNNIYQIIKNKKQNNQFCFLLIIFSLILIVIFKYIGNTFMIYPIIIFVFSLFVFINGCLEYINLRKMIKNDVLLDELKNKIIFYSPGYIITENFIIRYSPVIEIVSFKEIIFIQQKRNLEKGGISSYLEIITLVKKKFKFLINTSGIIFEDKAIVKDFSDIILKKNPSVLVGKTKENKKILLEKYNIKI